MDETPRHHDAPLLDTRLTPHRSLNPEAFRVLMIVTFVAALFLPFPGRRRRKENK